MPSKSKFKQSTLVHSMHLIFKMQGFPKLICSGFLISYCISVACAQEQIPDSPENQTADQTEPQADAAAALMKQRQALLNSPENPLSVQDSLSALKHQEQVANQIDELKPIQLDDNLEDLPVIPVDQGMANEIFRVAEDAKNEAKNYRENTAKTPEVSVSDVSQTELTEIKSAPVNIDKLMHDIQT